MEEIEEKEMGEGDGSCGREGREKWKKSCTYIVLLNNLGVCFVLLSCIMPSHHFF